MPVVQMHEKGSEIFGNHSSSVNNLGCACGWSSFTELEWVMAVSGWLFSQGKGFFLVASSHDGSRTF